MDGIRVLACDIFGTTVDWYSGVADQVARIVPDLDGGVGAAAFASQWREKYLPSMANVREGRRDWTAARLLDVEPAQVLMVAAHGWDLDGARDAGLRTAFLERPAEKGRHPADVTADLSVASFTELADVLSRE